MKLIIIKLTLAMLFSNTTSAKNTEPHGYEDSITVGYVQGHWGYTYQLQGFYVGIGTVALVPVSAQAFDVISKLDKESTYKCKLIKSTFVPKRIKPEEDSPISGGTYYAIEVDCKK